MKLEIAVHDVAGIRTALDGGADRIELCQALTLGGLTPSRGVMEEAHQSGVEFRVLIRPRGGGYQYTGSEVSAAVHDIAVACEAGASGVIIGALTDDGLDRPAVAAMVEAAAGRTVIVHRCVDVLLDSGAVTPAGLASTLRELGVDGVLTSGGAPRAIDGIGVITELAGAADGELEIVVGGGVRAEHISSFRHTGVSAIHLSASVATTAGPAGPGGGEDQILVTSTPLVEAARAALDRQTSSG
ncbi:copper homeostasis protein CutC [Bogoriella caseilytica]|uniref:PF03932 family protein CutC n=1 Tax=Bogoriella caseilytica TaxID=56055 RepID=A0A3N2B9I9_9MICO|nr:copper homeostasis protein CutC [Bogoriella caseilytica]ROR71802.1 copper homeostasis protein CutC [Bogoriella caseilytica]